MRAMAIAFAPFTTAVPTPRPTSPLVSWLRSTVSGCRIRASMCGVVSTSPPRASTASLEGARTRPWPTLSCFRATRCSRYVSQQEGGGKGKQGNKGSGHRQGCLHGQRGRLLGKSVGSVGAARLLRLLRPIYSLVALPHCYLVWLVGDFKSGWAAAACFNTACYLGAHPCAFIPTDLPSAFKVTLLSPVLPSHTPLPLSTAF